MILVQQRVGLHGRPFRLYKFRTMDGAGNVTRPWLRRTGLDELPQVLNILRGEMALFGPRPELPAIHDRCSAAVGPAWDARLRAKPGLLSLASLQGGIRGPERYSLAVKEEQAVLDNTMLDDMSWRLRAAMLRHLPAALLRGQLN